MLWIQRTFEGELLQNHRLSSCFKSKKKDQFNPGKPHANVANTNEDMSVKNQYQQGNFFTEDQYKQLVSMLTKSSAGENTSSSDGSTNLAGTFQWQGTGYW